MTIEEYPVEAIISSVARSFNVPRSIMVSKTRARPAAFPRFAAMKIMRQTRAMSYMQIAMALGRSDHCTIIRGIERANELIANDPGFASAYNRSCHAYVKAVGKFWGVQM